MFARRLFYLATLFLSVLLTKSLYAQGPVYLPSISSGVLSEESQYELKYEKVKEVLRERLKEITSETYREISFYWISQNQEWIYGYLLGRFPEDVPADGFNFLVRLSSENDPVVAFQYTKQFDEWLSGLPENIISSENRINLYSSTAYAQISGISPEAIDATVGQPQLSFPWREGYSWRFTSGPHHRDGPGITKRPWSGLDFAIPYASDGSALDQTVVSTTDNGTIIRIDPDCYVVVGYPGGWQIRYLHVKKITDVYDRPIRRGETIAEVPLTGACHHSTGPHVHIDLMYDLTYLNFHNRYIGGFIVQQGSSIYEGSLNLVPFMSIKRGGASYVKNQGYIGKKYIYGPLQPTKPADGIKVCTRLKCYYLSNGTNILPASQKEVEKMVLGKGYTVAFRTASATLASTDPNIPNSGFGCLDFDVFDLQNYNFPRTELSIRDNSTEMLVVEGTCNPYDRPTKKGSTSQDPNGESNLSETNTNFGCSNQTTGVKFHINSGSCFYMQAGQSSLPFSPTRIEVLDNNRKYDISICNAKGQCDEFNNTADIDHSSVSRPFTRVEVTPQGLVSSDAVGSCKTSTGRLVEFDTLLSGVKYYTDRSYTIKNIDKVELIGMRFLKTPNDDKMNTDPSYITCDIKKTTQIVIAFDRRASVLPSWMRGIPYEPMNRDLGVTDNEMQNFNIYACTQKAGYKLRLGGPQSDGAVNTRSNYIIVFRDAAQEKATDCSAKFNVPPDTPMLNEVDKTTAFFSAPLLEWSMSDRNFTDDYLQAYVNIWKSDILVSSAEWLPIGVTQWVPPLSEPAEYKAQVVVRDSKGMETISNQITYRIYPPMEACVAQ